MGPLLIMLVALLALLATMTGPVGLSGTLASGSGGQGGAGQGNSGATQNQHCDGHDVDDGRRKHEGGGSSTVQSDNGDVLVTVSEDGYSVSFSDPESGEPLTVDFCVKGSTDTASGTGSSWGPDAPEQLFTKSGEQAQISYVVVYRIVVEPPVCPSSLTLTLAPGHNPVNPVNTDHTKIATVRDQFGNNCGEGIDVRFEVASAGAPTPSEAVVATDQNGQAAFTYTNSVPGTDTVTACTTSEGDAPQACDTSQSSTQIWDTANKTWVTEPPEDEFFCRSDPVTLGLAGNDVIPFQANEESDPCETDADGLLVALSPLLGEGGLNLLNEKNQIVLGQDGFGSLTLDLLWARTEAGEDSAHAESGVLYFVANDGTSDQIILEVATSENSTDAGCNTTTMATLLAITVGGERIAVTDGNVVLIDPALDDLVIIRFEDGNDGGADEGPDDTGAQAVDALVLGAADLLGLTVADSESGCS